MSADPGPGRSNTVSMYRAVDGVASATASSGCAIPATNRPTYDSASASRNIRHPPPSTALARGADGSSAEDAHDHTPPDAPASAAIANGNTNACHADKEIRTPPVTNDPSSTGSSNRTRSATSSTGEAYPSATRDPASARTPARSPNAERRPARKSSQTARPVTASRATPSSMVTEPQPERFAPGNVDESTARSPSNTNATWWKGPR